MTSTAELVGRSQSGDQGAFAELVRRYERAVIVTAWGVLGDFHAAQDAGQEAFLIAYRNVGRLRAGRVPVLGVTHRAARSAANGPTAEGARVGR